jgi:amino acid transporter
MPDFSTIFAYVKTPHAAIVVVLFCALLLFFPLEHVGLAQLKLSNENSFIVFCMFLVALSRLSADFLFFAIGSFRRFINKRRRRRFVKKAVLSLNLEEICVLYKLCQLGRRTFKGSYDNSTIISMRSKGCLTWIAGPQSVLEMHYLVPDDIYEFFFD